MSHGESRRESTDASDRSYPEAPGAARQGWRGRVGALLPPAMSLPLRARFGQSREPELGALRRFANAGDTVVDIGAHKGVYTYWLSRLVGPTGSVLAFEPQPELRAYLQLGLARHRNVTLHDTAISDHDGSERLTIPVVDGEAQIAWASLEPVEGGGDTLEVSTSTLDRELEGRSVSFVKCDVEGHEFTVLRGAVKTLKARRTVWLVEVEQRHAGSRVEATLDLFARAGYEPYYLAGRQRLVAVPPEKRTATGLNRVTPGRYVNNFFFLPR